MSREGDIDMLRDVLEHKRLDPETRQAFESMLAALELGERHVLSQRQREWVGKFAQVPVYENLASKNGARRPPEVKHNHKELAECGPRCPLWKPPSLQNLPKRPPGGRA